MQSLLSEPIERGRYRARIAGTAEDISAAQRLRHLCFHGRAGVDVDAFDPLCRHLLVEERASGGLVACCRLMALDGAGIGQSYSAQWYDLAPLTRFAAPMLEIGRFCIRPALHDPDILRLVWGCLTGLVDRGGVRLLFGCSSFAGTEAAAHLDAFGLLHARHLAPQDRAPGVKAPRVFRFAEGLGNRRPDPRRAAIGMPPLLRSYLMMGGWVSDHAVVDEGLGTLHVFTGVEIDKVPAKRARVLRALAC